MEHPTSFGTQLRRPRRQVARDFEEPEVRYGRPEPLVRRERPEARPRRGYDRARDETDVGSLAASLPLILVGVACTGVAIYVHAVNSHATVARIPLWLPLVAIGMIALLGGALSVFASPSEVTEDDEPERPRRAVAPAPRRPRAPVRAMSWEPARRIPEEVEPDEPPPRVAPERVVPTAARTPLRPREHPEPVVLEADSAPPVEDSDDLATALEEIDSIDGYLHEPPRPRVPAPVMSPPPSTVDSDADAIDAELADLIGPDGPTASGAPSTRARRPPSEDWATVHCVECGARMAGSAAVVRCRGCQEPLCSNCQDRALAEEKPGLCVYCSVLDEFERTGTAPTDPTADRP